MNRFDIEGFDNTTFNWVNPQDGMHLQYGMSILAQCAKERALGEKLSQSQVDTYFDTPFGDLFDDFCLYFNSAIQKFMNLNVSDGWDIRRINSEGGFDYSGNFIDRGIRWEFNEIEEYLGLNEGDLSFIEDRTLPQGYITQKTYLSLMYKALSCLTHRIDQNFYRVQDIVNMKKYQLYPTRSWRQQSDSASEDWDDIKIPTDNFFNDLINNNWTTNEIFPPSNTDFRIYSLSWLYDNESRTYEKLSNGQLGEFHAYTRGLSTRYNSLIEVSAGGGIGSTRETFSNPIAIFSFSDIDGSFYGQTNLSPDYKFNVITAGSSFSPSTADNLKGANNFMSEDFFYSSGEFDYKKVKILNCNIIGGRASTVDVKLADIDDLSIFPSISDPENNQRTQFGMSLQAVPVGNINNEYYSDYITEAIN